MWYSFLSELEVINASADRRVIVGLNESGRSCGNRRFCGSGEVRFTHLMSFLGIVTHNKTCIIRRNVRSEQLSRIPKNTINSRQIAGIYSSVKSSSLENPKYEKTSIVSQAKTVSSNAAELEKVKLLSIKSTKQTGKRGSKRTKIGERGVLSP